MASFDAPFHNFLGMRFEKRQTFFKKKFLPFLDFHSEEILDRRVCRFAPWPSGCGAFHSRKGKEQSAMDRKLSTGGGSPSGKRKKREAEKRKSPLTPLREKGKGKEQDRVSCETCSKTARAHVRRKLPCACSFSEAGAAAAEIVGRQLLSAEREGLRSLGVVLPPLRQGAHRR